jgi:3D (Asp-Asp-Asp) domain-containing protein
VFFLGLFVVLLGFVLWNMKGEIRPLSWMFGNKNAYTQTVMIPTKTEVQNYGMSNIYPQSTGFSNLSTDTPVPRVTASTTRENPTATATIQPTKEIIPTATIFGGGYVNPHHQFYATGLYSLYWPPLGGQNCWNGDCEHVSTGYSYRDYVNFGCACPANIPLGSDIYIQQLDLHLLCVDRGGAVSVTADGFIWIDQLTESSPLARGTKIDLIITYPY